jgi:hypothetical protein
VSQVLNSYSITGEQLSIYVLHDEPTSIRNLCTHLLVGILYPTATSLELLHSTAEGNLDIWLAYKNLARLVSSRSQCYGTGLFTSFGKQFAGKPSERMVLAFHSNYL